MSSTTSDVLSIYTLGGLKIELDGRLIIDANKAKWGILLVFLAEAERPVPRLQLARFLWPNVEDTAALSNLRSQLTRMRHAGLTRHLIADRAAVGLDPEAPLSYDARRFRRTVDRVDETDIAKLDEALRLYHGRFLEDVQLRDEAEIEEWILTVQQELEASAISGLQRIIRLAETSGDTASALDYANRLLKLAPYEDESHLAYMRTLATAGRAMDALRHARAYRRILQDEFGMTDLPPQVQAFIQGVQESTVQFAGEGDSPRHVVTAPIPRQRGFVGRQDELRQLRALVEQPASKLITIVGLGGIGKTALVAELAEYLKYHFRNGVLFVDLGQVPLPGKNVEEHPAEIDSAYENLVTLAIGRAAGLTLSNRNPVEEQLLNFLAQRHMCLILDNFEPFLPARALLSRLSLYAPETTIIVTTRTRLNLQQEMIFPLKGLPLPADASMDALEQSSAVQFYCAQVRRSMIDFELTAANGASIKRIVDQVWGHPLALTMLATWAEHFSQEEIALEMEQGTNLFSAEAADIPERQQSMDRIIDAAWRKLDGDAQRVLAGLSYFACPFDRASAQAVADATPGVLRDLVGLSLLSTAQQGAYNMHPLVRHFAVAKLAEMQDADGPLAPRVARGHAKYWLGLLQRASKTDDASSVLREYQPNLAVALDWTVRHAPTLLIDSIQGPCAYWMELGYFAEAQYWLEQLLDKTEPNSAERATVLNYAVVFARRRQDFAAAEAMGREAGEIWEALGAKRELAATYEHLGWTEYDRNTGTDMARVWFEKSLALWRELGEDVRAANVLRGLASHQMTSDTRSALGILDEAAALAEQLGNETFLCKARLHRLYIAALEPDEHPMLETEYREVVAILHALRQEPYQQAWDCIGLSETAFFLGHFQEAEEFGTQAQALFANMSAPTGYTAALIALANAYRAQEAWDQGADIFRQALAQASTTEDLVRETLALIGLADCVYKLGRVEDAIRLLAAAQPRMEQLLPHQYRTPRDPVADWEQQVAAIRASVPADFFDKQWTWGRMASSQELTKSG